MVSVIRVSLCWFLETSLILFSKKRKTLETEKQKYQKILVHQLFTFSYNKVYWLQSLSQIVMFGLPKYKENIEMKTKPFPVSINKQILLEQVYEIIKALPLIVMFPIRH